MARPLTDYDPLRAQLEKCLGGCTHKKRIRIHFDAGDVFDEVGLKEHRLGAQVEVKFSEAGEKKLHKTFRVPLHGKNCHPRTRWPPVAQKHFFREETYTRHTSNG
jgi:hypothetical protein